MTYRLELKEPDSEAMKHAREKIGENEEKMDRTKKELVDILKSEIQNR